MHDYRKLIVWEKAIDFTTKIYKTTETFPRKEEFGLTSQIRRAAVSVPSNIAEGVGRESNKAFLYFLEIAFGSINELITQITISHRLNYIDKKSEDELITEIQEIQKMVFRLRNKLKSE